MQELDKFRRYNRVLMKWQSSENNFEELLKCTTRIFFNYQTYFSSDEELNEFFKTLEETPYPVARRAFSITQLKSKAWIVESLKEAGITNLGTVYVLGGWCGLLGQFLLRSADIETKQVFSFDIDDDANIIADKLNNVFRLKAWKFKSINHDMFNLNYTLDKVLIDDKAEKGIEVELGVDTIFNTSCEHIDVKKWIDLIPSGKQLVLQSNNYFEDPEHINCHNSLDEFISDLNLSDIQYSGALNLGEYQRYLVIGKK